MARFLEALRRHPTPTPSGEVTPRRDRRIGKAGSLATAATLLLAVPGVALATMGNTGEGPNGGQHASSVISHGQGEIHPEGAPEWCLAGKAEPGGTPPKVNSRIEVRPCAPDNPFQKWNVAIERTGDEPDKLVAQLHGLNLCIAGTILSTGNDVAPARLDDCNLPTTTLIGRDVGNHWQIWDPQGVEILGVPKRLMRSNPYDVAIWIDADALENGKVIGENTLFELPHLSAARGGGGSSHPSVM